MYATAEDYILAYGEREAIDRTHGDEPARFALRHVADEGRTVRLSGFSHPYGTVATATVDWGDGSPAVTQAGPAPLDHTYAVEGVYTVQVSFQDAPPSPGVATVYSATAVVDTERPCPHDVDVYAVYLPRLLSCLTKATGRVKNALLNVGYALPFDAANYPSATVDALEVATGVLNEATLALARCCLWKDQQPEDIADACDYWKRWLGRWYSADSAEKYPPLGGIYPPTSAAPSGVFHSAERRVFTRESTAGMVSPFGAAAPRPPWKDVV